MWEKISTLLDPTVLLWWHKLEEAFSFSDHCLEIRGRNTFQTSIFSILLSVQQYFVYNTQLSCCAFLFCKWWQDKMSFEVRLELIYSLDYFIMPWFERFYERQKVLITFLRGCLTCTIMEKMRSNITTPEEMQMIVPWVFVIWRKATLLFFSEM